MGCSINDAIRNLASSNENVLGLAEMETLSLKITTMRKIYSEKNLLES